MSDNSILPENSNSNGPGISGLARPVVLVGLMGAGKSTIGRRLARELGVAFVDSDEAIAEAAGCSVSDIFEIYGEAMFRDLEQRVLIRLLSQEPVVLATGGGAFMNADIRSAIRSHGISIWLRAELDTLVERVSRRNTRPLLEAGDKRTILARLIEERHPVYETAEITVDSSDGAHDHIVKNIITQLKEYAKKKP